MNLPPPNQFGRIEAPPGIYPGTDFASYVKIVALNNSTLKRGEQSAEHLRYALDHPEAFTETEALRFGKLFHLALLEPERFQAEVSDAYPQNKQGKPFGWDTNARREAEAILERMVVSEPDLMRIVAMTTRVQDHPEAAQLLKAKTSTEVVAVWDCPATGVRCKARVDLYAKGLALIDVKTTDNAAPSEFEWSVSKYGYAQQAALYQDGWRALTGETLDFGIIAVEKEEPHGTALYQLDAHAINRGRAMYRKTLRHYAECVRLGKFPGYPSVAVMLGLAGREKDGPTEDYETRMEMPDPDPFGSVDGGEEINFRTEKRQ